MTNKSKQSAYYRDEYDFYVEEKWVTRKLLEVEKFWESEYILDPCSGSENIVNTIDGWGYTRPDSMDIVQRANQDYVEDFLQTDEIWESSQGLPFSLVFNPPYRQAKKFIEHSLKFYTHKVCALVRLDFLASQERYDLNKTVNRVWILSKRPSMPPGEAYLRGEVEAKGGQHDYCWMVWDKTNPQDSKIGFLK